MLRLPPAPAECRDRAAWRGAALSSGSSPSTTFTEADAEELRSLRCEDDTVAVAARGRYPLFASNVRVCDADCERVVPSSARTGRVGSGSGVVPSSSVVPGHRRNLGGNVEIDEHGRRCRC